LRLLDSLSYFFLLKKKKTEYITTVTFKSNFKPGRSGMEVLM
jgi:hypothetical protein